MKHASFPETDSAGPSSIGQVTQLPVSSQGSLEDCCLVCKGDDQCNVYSFCGMSDVPG